jgi:hypothetical protein
MPSGGGNSIITSSTAMNNNQFKYFRPTKIDHDERRPRGNFISESELNDHIILENPQRMFWQQGE